jgi:carbon starvation protein CstA
MDDQRWEPGMPVLDRQAVREPVLPPSLAGLPPRSVPETAPTPLQRHYVLLSVGAFLAGAIGITALEAGMSPASPLVKLCALVAAPIIVVTTLDAAVRIWRSAWAWMPVNRGRGLFRLSWLVVAAVFIAVTVAISGVILAS